MGKLYTDTQHKFDSTEKSEEVEIEIPGNILTIYLLQGIKSFSVLTIIGILVKLLFFSSKELESFLIGYGVVILVIFSLISSSRFRSGNTLASGSFVGTGSSSIVNAEVNYMRKNRIKVSSYYIWLLFYGSILVIIAQFFL